MKFLLPLLLLAVGCKSKKSHQLKSSKWQLYSFSEKLPSRLDDLERTFIKGFNEDSSSNKIFLHFNTDSTFELSMNSPNGETSLYQLKADTIFIQSPDKTQKDTFILTKQSKELLHIYNLRGLDCKFKRVQ
jgi:hypothetical protein